MSRATVDIRIPVQKILGGNTDMIKEQFPVIDSITAHFDAHVLDSDALGDCTMRVGFTNSDENGVDAFVFVVDERLCEYYRPCRIHRCLRDGRKEGGIGVRKENRYVNEMNENTTHLTNRVSFFFVWGGFYIGDPVFLALDCWSVDIPFMRLMDLSSPETTAKRESMLGQHSFSNLEQQSHNNKKKNIIYARSANLHNGL